MPSSSASFDSASHYTKNTLPYYPNRWAQFRSYIREPASEFLGAMVLIIFGTGVDCQVVLSGNPGVASSSKGEYLSISFGWATATALGVWVAGASGGHINPAVTITMAVFRGFPWRKVPIFIFSQILGAFTGAALVYANYYNAINIFEGGVGVRTVPGTASLFSTYAADYMTSAGCFFSEFLATAVLLIIVLAVNDPKSGPPPAGLVPLVLFITVFAEGACLGMQTAYAMNPARDLGPRLLTYMAGYGREVWNYRHQYWLWVPILGPITGALAGTIVYDALIYTGADSIFNKPNAEARRALAAAQDDRHSSDKVPPGMGMEMV
ncbi:hypothetical protein BOTBODRAFT_27139 [Botryobasidium botryosum FD-172 SS1]|uniref:Aquaporin n=1 Tax=Botryobasidium botryosum (strain FD-172 SS1) TaxID=930990 RepID=A0A067N6F5_BOTB1|nr:hypothetical protein BOTBODRAFT_27139 [Botryobasidium botryosum FD-172 SS1]